MAAAMRVMQQQLRQRLSRHDVTSSSYNSTMRIALHGRQALAHPPCNAVQAITHALTPHVALQSHPPQPATNKNATSADAVAQWLQRVRRERNFQTMNSSAVVKGRRGDDEFMNGFPAALLRLFQTTRKQLEDFFPSRYPFRFYKTVDIAVVVSRNRLLLVAGGRLCAKVATQVADAS